MLSFYKGYSYYIFILPIQKGNSIYYVSELKA